MYPSSITVRQPPVKIQGIKTKLVNWIAEHITWDESRGRWIEPFTGSGSVGFNLAGEEALFSDNNPHLIALYQAFNDEAITTDWLMDYLTEQGKQLAEFGASWYYDMREVFNKHGATPENFVFLNRTGYNGLIRYNNKGEYNTPYGKCDKRLTNKAYLKKIREQFQWFEDRQVSWDFATLDFREVLPMAKPEDFVYLDPPYYGKNARYYTDWQEKDAKELVELIKQLPCHWALSTWNMPGKQENPMLSELLGIGAACYTYSHRYVIGPQQEQRHSVQELLIVR